jgi:ABC-type lipoprotein release transport system permease subunit
MKSRSRNLLNYSLNCIHRYKIRTAVILVCLVVSAAVFSSVAFIKDGLVNEGQLSLKNAPDLTVQGMWAGRPTFIETANIGYIQESPGVNFVEPRIWGYGNVGNQLIVIVGVDPQSQNIDQSATFSISQGSFLDLNQNNTIVIGQAVADLVGAKVGSVLSILTESVQPRKYIVVGIFSSESSIYNADMIIMNMNDARILFNVPEDKVTDIAIYLSDRSLSNVVAKEIGDLPNTRVITKDILLQSQQTTYGARSGYFSLVWYVILLAVAIVSFNQTVVVGHESKFEVGLLKALGFSTTDVIKIRLIESAILGGIAGTIGVSIGIFYDAVLRAPIISDFMLGWATLYPNFTLPVYFSAQTILLVYAVTIIPLLFATVIPSWRNATVDPDIAMRGAIA